MTVTFNRARVTETLTKLVKECGAAWVRRATGQIEAQMTRAGRQAGRSATNGRRDYYRTCPQSKGEPRAVTKARRDRLVQANTRITRDYVFAREQDRCRVCGCPAESMHEMKSAGATGSRLKATNKHNSVAVCGSGTTGCHGLLQQYIVRPLTVDAEGYLTFHVRNVSLRHPEVRAMLQRYGLIGSHTTDTRRAMVDVVDEWKAA